ncbi:MAG: hypothetical protein V2B14_04450 [bacterium]
MINLISSSQISRGLSLINSTLLSPIIPDSALKPHNLGLKFRIVSGFKHIVFVAAPAQPALKALIIISAFLAQGDDASINGLINSRLLYFIDNLFI